jgi:hypothetical protein
VNLVSFCYWHASHHVTGNALELVCAGPPLLVIRGA